MANLVGQSNDLGVAAVHGTHLAGAAGAPVDKAAIVGQSDDGLGVLGRSAHGTAVDGVSKSGYGTAGESDTSVGVIGLSKSGTGVFGQSNDGIGVVGESKNSEGVRGVSHNAHGGIVGINDWSPSAPPGAGGNGGWFESTQGEGVRGWSKTPHHGGVVGVNTAGGVGVYGEGRVAGFFKGDVEVTGDIRLMNADCAEDFTVSEVALVEPGTVMVLGEEEILQPSHQAYDKRVAGVISGAGNYKPGIVLDKQESQQRRLPVALLGKVYCKVDAQYGAIAVGDLLTTSPTLGHAMKADDPAKAFGAVIGKALRPLAEGYGLIPILIALQ